LGNFGMLFLMVLSISSAEGSFKILTARGWGYEEWPFIEAGRLLTRLFSRTVNSGTFTEGGRSFKELKGNSALKIDGSIGKSIHNLPKIQNFRKKGVVEVSQINFLKRDFGHF